jgi:OFA family oxalate/formate antiporter-like MFS transporter
MGRNTTMILNALIMLCGLLSLNFLVPSLGYPLLLISIILIGMSFGGAIPIASAIVSTAFGNKYFGFNYGLATTPLVIAAIIGPYFGGYLYTQTHSYTVAILLSAGLAVIGIIAGIIIKDPSPIIDADRAQSEILEPQN